MKSLIIVNPVAGKMKVKDDLFDIVYSLSKQGYESTVHITSAKGEATEKAMAESGNYDLIVACGGDGTLNEVIAGILRSDSHPLLLYYPCGSTNDFATTLGLPKKIDSEKFIISERKILDLDVGVVNDNINFSYIASFGIFTKASYSAQQKIKNSLGHLAYLLEATKEFGDLGKSYHTKVTWDEGVIEGNYILVAATNSTSAGGVLRLSENEVKLDDGMLEILLIKALSNPSDTLAVINKLLRQQYDGENVVLVHTKNAVIECDSAPAWTTDGECAGNIARAEIKCLSGVIRLIV